MTNRSLHGSAKFRAWRETNGFSQKSVSDALKCCSPLISLYESRKLTPSYEMAIQIEAVTDRKVRIEDWGFAPDLRTIIVELTTGTNSSTLQPLKARK